MIPQISIIVTARNYSEFLAECLSSCLNQSVPAHEVIYSDDFSDDDSLKVAAKFPVKIVKHKSHVGVVQARNDGVDASSGNALVHVDGDDMLPFDFLEKHLQVFDQSTPFVYCAAQAFGNFSTFWRVYPWKVRNLWDRNFVNTSALIWKDAFVKAGKWQNTCGNTMWDWSLALRLSRLGTPRKSPAVLMYRQHNSSWSLSREKRGRNLINLSTSIRREIVNVTVGLVYAGRLPSLFPLWMKSLCDDVAILHNKPQLVIVNNSGSDMPISAKHKKCFSEIRIITGPGKFQFSSEVERRNKVCELLADCYNMILENASGEIIHLREDDIIGQSGSFEQIFNFITDDAPVKHAAAGVYLNRNPQWRKLVGGYYNAANPSSTSDLEKLPVRSPFVVDFTGTGFICFWKHLCPDVYHPYVDGIQAHDWAWCLDLKKMGGKVYMIPSAVCRHYNTADNYLLPPSDLAEITPQTTYSKLPMSDKPKFSKPPVLVISTKKNHH